MTTPRQRPTFLQAVTIAGAGLLIALFGCLGFLAGFGNGTSASTLSEIGGVGFGLGLVIFIIGGILVLIVIFRSFFGSSTGASSAVPGDSVSSATASAAVQSDAPGPPEGE